MTRERKDLSFSGANGTSRLLPSPLVPLQDRNDYAGALAAFGVHQVPLCRLRLCLALKGIKVSIVHGNWTAIGAPEAVRFRLSSLS